MPLDTAKLRALHAAWDSNPTDDYDTVSAMHAGLGAALEEIEHIRRVIDQRDRDWDALMIEIAKTVGDDDDREAAEMGEIEEFDPWQALRTARKEQT